MTIRFIFLILLAGGWLLAASSVYVVRTSAFFQPVVLVPRGAMANSWEQIKGCYVDTRNWTAEDAAKNPDVVNRLLQTGNGNLLKHLTISQKPLNPQAQLMEVTSQLLNRNTTISTLQNLPPAATPQAANQATKTKKKPSTTKDGGQTNWANLLGS